MSLTDETFRTLLAGSRSGKPDARNTLAEGLRDYLYAHRDRLPAILHRRADHSDMVQETVLKLIQSLDGFQGESLAELFAWATTSLRRHQSEFVRNQNADLRDIKRESDEAENSSAPPIIQQLAGTQSTPSHQAARAEFSQLRIEFIDRLPDRERDVMKLRDADFTTIEIAAKLEMTRGQVSGYLKRARERLDEWLRPYEDRQDD